MAFQSGPARCHNTRWEEGSNISKLIEDDILRIMKLFESSSFDFLQLEFGDLKLTVSKAGYHPSPASGAGAERPAAPPQPEPPTAPATAPRAVATPENKAQVRAAADGVPIPAPMVGTFYTAPSPGAPPFISLGDTVKEDTTVGLIEVMKVFNAVTAGVAGIVSEVWVQNGAFVEYGQPLFMITPGANQSAKGSAE